MMWCIVNLPNGTQQAIQWDSKAIGQECLEKVCKALGIICESEYFGLEHWNPHQEESRTHQWINLRNRLSYDSNNGIQLMLALRVKFWVPIHCILQESVRDIFYMQAKADLLEGRLNTRDWESAARIAALLCQADGIRFNELTLKSECPVAHRNGKENSLNHQQHAQAKDRKDKDHVLSFKKRRLSKQKSVENIDSIQAFSTSTTTIPPNAAQSTTIVPPSSSATATSAAAIEERLGNSPLRIYQNYIVCPQDDCTTQMPENFLRQIAIEHGKLSTLRLSSKLAKYSLLQEIQDLPGYGEEVYSGVTANENSLRCDIAVGANGITVCTDDEQNRIAFSAIATAKSFRRIFKLEYFDDHGIRKELVVKLQKHAIAAGLYRSITERHAFYVCDKVRGVVTNQFTRDLKGTIASMFKEDTELGKRYVFDIQHTCREVHDQARRILRERGADISTYTERRNSSEEDTSIFEAIYCNNNNKSFIDERKSSISSMHISLSAKLDLALHEKQVRETEIERCVDNRISEAMACKICMDRTINTIFNPCSHILACSECAQRCTNCPICRVEITNVVKIYLPPELRTRKQINKHDEDESDSNCSSRLLTASTVQASDV